MADATNRPPVKTPQPQRDDLQRLIPDNVRLRRALEQLFIDVNQTLPDAVQTVGDNSQAISEDLSMGVFGATDRRASRIETELGNLLDARDDSALRKVLARLEDLEKIVSDIRPPVKPRIERFIAPTLINAWANFGGTRNPAGYYKDPFGVVHLRGLIASGTIGLTAFTLPAGYRPTNNELMIALSNGAVGAVDINSNGNVTPSLGNNAYVSLDGLTFRAA